MIYSYKWRFVNTYQPKPNKKIYIPMEGLLCWAKTKIKFNIFVFFFLFKWAIKLFAFYTIYLELRQKYIDEIGMCLSRADGSANSNVGLFPHRFSSGHLNRSITETLYTIPQFHNDVTCHSLSISFPNNSHVSLL